ncbi:hypothetical protein TNCV_2308531 [Trichonephila clavipes]|nr:hypothetical protein TNCV_2308531 [Trichonephila clavipes]
MDRKPSNVPLDKSNTPCPGAVTGLSRLGCNTPPHQRGGLVSWPTDLPNVMGTSEESCFSTPPYSVEDLIVPISGSSCTLTRVLLLNARHKALNLAWPVNTDIELLMTGNTLPVLTNLVSLNQAVGRVQGTVPASGGFVMVWSMCSYGTPYTSRYDCDR